MTQPHKEIGQCSLCRTIIYSDDVEAIEINGALFCTVSCAEEVTGHEIKTGTLTVVSEDDCGNKEYSYTCPYCNKINGQNEGSSVAMENGRCITACVYCGKESICIE